jgi:hypothetical protein
MRLVKVGLGSTSRPGGVHGVFIGLDVSLAKTAICVVDRDGAVQWQGKVPSEPVPLIKRLTEWLGNIFSTSLHRR